MELSPFLNHWWHVTLYVTPRGLTTSSIPYHGSTFDVTFDFIEHNLCIRTSKGTTKALPLIPRSVAAFYREFMACLHDLGIEVTINTLPSEVQNPIRCSRRSMRFFKAPMKRGPHLGSGIARHWKGEHNENYWSRRVEADVGPQGRLPPGDGHG